MPESEAPPLIEVFAVYRKYAKILGKRIAELHRALATPTNDPAFIVEPLTEEDMRVAIADARDMARRALAGVDRMLARTGDGAVRECLEAFSRRREECEGVIDRLGEVPSEAVKLRIHGDFHLGQVLVAQKEMVIVDFEGEPSRPFSERRLKSSPLRDVAGMLRSFSYVAETVVRDVGQRLTEAAPRVRTIAAEWRQLSTTAFLSAYEATVRGSTLWIKGQARRRRLLRFYLLSKALYEVDYEANNRPDWIETAVRGVLAILDDEAGVS